jgi:2'-5' RNA ligase
MPRLFIAVNFSAEVKSRLLFLEQRICEQAVKGRFTPRENLHLTLVFLGETDESALPDIQAALSGIKTAPFTLELSRLGFFKRAGGDIWWIGPDEDGPGTEPLNSLHRDICAGTGRFISGPQSLNAHVTLGRDITLRGRPDRGIESIAVKVERVSLMQSTLGRGPPVYTEIFACNLG